METDAGTPTGTFTSFLTAVQSKPWKFTPIYLNASIRDGQYRNIRDKLLISLREPGVDFVQVGAVNRKLLNFYRAKVNAGIATGTLASFLTAALSNPW